MEKISTLLKKVIKKSGYDKKLTEARIFIHYREMVGEKIASISKPSYIRNGILFIGVKNSTWSNQLYFFKDDIKNKINNKLSKSVVKDIKFCIRKIEKSTVINNTDKDKEITNYKLPQDKIKNINNISSDVKDPDLRQKFKQLMMKDLKYKLTKEEDSCLSI